MAFCLVKKKYIIIHRRMLFDVITEEVGCQSDKYTNPVERSNRPDPGVLAVPGGYVLVSTSNLARPGQDPAFPIMFSHDLVTWIPKGKGLFIKWILDTTISHLANYPRS